MKSVLLLWILLHKWYQRIMIFDESTFQQMRFVNCKGSIKMDWFPNILPQHHHTCLILIWHHRQIQPTWTKFLFTPPATTQVQIFSNCSENTCFLIVFINFLCYLLFYTLTHCFYLFFSTATTRLGVVKM